jgi:acetamidase/formamidase
MRMPILFSRFPCPRRWRSTVENGDSVVYETRDVSDNQITPDSTAEAIAALDWDRVYPLAGPVRVEGAEPGDALAIEILAMETRGWGYTIIIPGFGLLPDEFPDPYIRVFDLSNGEFAYLRDDFAIPVEPFFGTMGVCPAGAKEHAVMPPGRFVGNMDRGSSCRARRSTCRWRSSARRSAAVTRTRPRATGRYA